MEDKELSQWFDINEEKPWEPGVYEVDEDSFGKWFSYWDGKKFGYLTMDVNAAIEEFSSHTDFVVEKWRGLASDPSAKPKPKGNRKVTRYVVRSYDKQKVFASFENVDNARLYADGINEPVSITKIRFRTPEA